MAPFRELASPDDLGPLEKPPSTLVAHGFDHRVHRVLCRNDEGTEHLLFDRTWGTLKERAWLALDPRDPALCTHEGLLSWSTHGPELTLTSLRAPQGARWAPPPGEAPTSVQVAPLVLEDRPHVLIAAHRAPDSGRGPLVCTVGEPAASLLPAPWEAPANARGLLCAATTVYGPVALFATDRDDEIELSRAPTASAKADTQWSRTVSLGPRQRFLGAVGGGRQIAVLSGNDGGLILRTLASDLRSELNTVPLPHRIGREPGRVFMANALGPFVLLYEELVGGETESQLLLFDGTHLQAHALGKVRYDGLTTKGREVCLLRMVGGASVPALELTHFHVSHDRKNERWQLDCVGNPLDETAVRATVLPLGPAPLQNSAQRRTHLGDLCHALCASLSAGTPREVHYESRGDEGDVVLFRLVRGALSFGLGVLVRPDGSGVLTMRVGEQSAPMPRGLTWLEFARRALTGDDDGDPLTERVALTRVWAALEHARRLIAVALKLDLTKLDGTLPQE